MADSRSISGTVAVTQVETVAATANELALGLWIAEFDASPKASEGKFLDLVCRCAQALKGSSPYGTSFEDVVGKMFAK